MPRRKSKDNTPPTTDGQPAGEQQAQEPNAHQQVPAAEADSTAAGQPPAPGTGTQEAAAQPPARRPMPDPFGIAGDYVAGVHLAESKRYRQMQIRFDDKPSQDVIDKIKEAGYRYNGQDKVWVKPIMPDSAMRDRIDAERLFKELSAQIRDEKGAGRTV